LLGELNDVLLAGRTFLPVYEPFAQAVHVENVIANGDLHQLFILLEVAKAQLALGLLNHVILVPRVVELVGVRVFKRLVDHAVHDLEVDRNHGFHSL
jgi:hypothetical protein